MNPFAKKNPGDPFEFPAALYNAIIDAVTRRVGGQGVGSAFRDGTVIRVQNKTGGGLDELSVVAIGDPDFTVDTDTIEAFLSDPVMEGNVPTSDDAGKFGILLARTEDAGTADAVVAGVVIVKVDEGDGSDFADVADGVTDSLIATASGAAKILWRQSGSGKQWAVVRIGGGGGISKGELDGQGLYMTSQNEMGWADLRLVNR